MDDDISIHAIHLSRPASQSRKLEQVRRYRLLTYRTRYTLYVINNSHSHAMDDTKPLLITCTYLKNRFPAGPFRMNRPISGR